MASNFDFLESEWPELAQLGQIAENYLYDDPNACKHKLGLLVERLVNMLIEYNHDSIRVSSDSTLAQRIASARRARLLPDDIYNTLKTLREDRNDAAHDYADTIDEAKTMLRSAYELCCWFMEEYGENWGYSREPYHEPEKTGPEERRLRDQCPECIQSFVGRNAELNIIHEKLRINNRVFISGDRGIGKTELAKYYANLYRDEYDVISFAEYPGSMDELISKSGLITIENGTDDTITVNALSELLNDRTLLIIDNFSFSRDDSIFAQLIKSKLLITTAENLANAYDPSQIVELTELPLEEQLTLFQNEHDAPLTEEEANIVKQILSEIHGYTLLIPLIAKLLKNSSLGFKNVLTKIKEAGAMSLNVNVIHKKDFTVFDDPVPIILRAVLDMSSLSIDEQFVLKCIAAIKDIRIERSTLIGWIGEQYENAVNYLERKRWIHFDGSGRSALLSMHGIIRDLVMNTISLPISRLVQEAVDEYLSTTKDLFFTSGLKRSYTYFYSGIPSDWFLSGAPRGIEGVRLTKKRFLIETLFQSIDVKQEAELLINQLSLIINGNMNHAYHFAPNCDNQLETIEKQGIVNRLSYEDKFKLHTLRVYLALKSLCGCDQDREDCDVKALTHTVISHTKQIITLTDEQDDYETASTVIYDELYRAFLTAGITFGTNLFATHYPDYSLDALEDFTHFVNEIALNTDDYEYKADPDDTEFDDYYSFNVQDCFNNHMTPGSYETLLNQEAEIDAAESQDYFDAFCNTANMTPQERIKFEINQRILTLCSEAEEILQQCGTAGYRAIDDPENHPEISVGHLTEPAVLKKATELLSAAKIKLTAAALLDQQTFDGTYGSYLQNEYSRFHWLETACVVACCKQKFDSAKQFYLNHLHADPVGVGLIPGGPNLKMFKTLRHLGFKEMSLEILKLNIQFLEGKMAEGEIKDPDSENRFSYDSVWECVCRIIEYADLLGDEELKKKYVLKKRCLEDTGIELDQ